MYLRQLLCSLILTAAYFPRVATVAEPVAEEIWPGGEWQAATPTDVSMDGRLLQQARDYALTGDGSGFIIRHGRLVMSWGDSSRRYDLKSTTKSIGITALGLAIGDGKISLNDLVNSHHSGFGVPPKANAASGWINQITIRHLATQTAGFEKPGGYTKLTFKPGTKWAYSDGGPNWLAECITLVYRKDVNDLMFERIFTPLGIKRDDLTWRRNSYRERSIDGIPRREFGSGISADVDAMARIGYLYLREGRWEDKQLIPSDFVEAARTTLDSVVGIPEVDPDNYGNASDHYGLLWWNNADGSLPDVPRDAYWSWGLHDSLIVVIPSLDIVVARAGKGWKRGWAGHYDVLKPFLTPIVKSVQEEQVDDTDQQRQSKSRLPYPPSPVIDRIEWAPVSTVIRRAKGSDNWPMTWSDDDAQYTAYGDGWGFKPRVERKLSMGLCRVTGGPDDFKAVNLRSTTAERTGQGPRGPKASSMLMVDGTLYMLVRNTSNSQLAWSEDHGHTWTWSKWKLTTSFGYPAFLNFGRNYEGARDRYVYVYSHDSDSAYERSGQMVLARSPQDQLRSQKAWQFFSGIKNGQPQWSNDIKQRVAVFTSADNCYRSSVSYNSALKRYMWCQTGSGKDTRFQGGFAIYDAPEPWGPWTTVYHTDAWDIGPGETCCLPTKWISEDGLTVHLVFSGDDSFSVRQATLVLR